MIAFVRLICLMFIVYGIGSTTRRYGVAATAAVDYISGADEETELGFGRTGEGNGEEEEDLESLMRRVMDAVRDLKQQQQQGELDELRRELLDELSVIRHQLNTTSSQLTEQQEYIRQLLQRLSGTTPKTEAEDQPKLFVDKEVHHTIHGYPTIHGIATRNNMLYVGRGHGPIEIYDARTLNRIGNQSVPGLRCVQDMASCPSCDVVYIADFCNHAIYVIDDSGLRTQWNVTDKLTGVSANSESNVVVVFRDARKLREFTSTGRLVREITLSSDLQNPNHAIQLEDGRYAVAQGTRAEPGLHRVCIVDVNGTPGQCYGGSQGSGDGQISRPAHLQVFAGWLMVAELGNNRVLLFNFLSSLSYAGELINATTELQHPARMALSGGRLFVAYSNTLKAFDLDVL